jgi:hypothetical protein
VLNVDLATVVGLEGYLEAAPDRTRRSMSIAMNDVLRGPGLARYRVGVANQINLPPDYIDQRLTFDKFSTPSDLTASIVGRQRPTSLARFATGGAVGAKGGVSVRVQKNGGGSRLPGAFLVRLNKGPGISDDNYNLGLAVRLKPGQTTIGTKKDTSQMVHLAANVVLLYGPSIDQVLNNSVVDAETPEVTSAVATEFYRQFARMAD